jgi:hypothetical protein
MSAFTRVFIILAFGLVYTLGYFLLTFLTIGAGHGTMIFASALPMWVIFLGCLVSLLWIERKDVRNGIIGAMVVNYCVTALLIYAFESVEFSDTIRYFEHYPEMVTYSLAWYLAGQIIFWILYFKKTAALNGGLP